MEIDINETEEKIQDIDEPRVFYLLNLDYASEKFYAFARESLKVKKGDLAVVPTKYGVDLARVCGEVSNFEINEDVVEIVRIATEDDLLQAKGNTEKEKEAGEIFKEKVKANKLDMKFILAHFLLEESKVLFFFSADGRVDFRALVKDLVAVFKVRVELRQIGVRDETRFVGGLASCGRPFCCHLITDKMTGVSIKMAKEQNLSLNSSRISGHCGRLLCCLSYEHEYYTTESKKIPQAGVKIYYDNSLFTVKEVNHITNTVSLLGTDGRSITLPSSRFKRNGDTWKIS
ncbi:MAG: PSP1 domain-containing protein [Treponema sp.]